MRKKNLLFTGLSACVLLLAALLTKEESVLPANAPAAWEEPTKYVALTFDDGPDPVQTARLLEGLQTRGVSATFFLIGSQIPANEALVQQMAAQGHQVGNHTWSHSRLESRDPALILEDIHAADRLLQSLLGPDSYWLRPPYGLIDPALQQQLAVPLVKWSVDPRDWESRNTEAVTRAVLQAVEPGSIILLHDIYASSVDAAFAIIDTLIPQNYCFVTVEELLLLNGVQPQNGTMYRRAESP